MPKSKSKSKSAAPSGSGGSKGRKTPPPPSPSQCEGIHDDVGLVDHGQETCGNDGMVQTDIRQSLCQTASPTQAPELETGDTNHPVSVMSCNAPSLGLHVSNQTRQNITDGQFVNLASLLPSSTLPGHLSLNDNGEIVSREAQSKSNDTLDKWVDAFLICMDIYISAHPIAARSMLKYVYTIRLGAKRAAIGWKEYDVQYRLRKGDNPSASWGEVDTELWLLYMGSNNHGRAVSHTYKQGRSQGTCYDYNFKGTCFKHPCLYLHLCMRCGGDHPISMSNMQKSFLPQQQPFLGQRRTSLQFLANTRQTFNTNRYTYTNPRARNPSHTPRYIGFRPNPSQPGGFRQKSSIVS
ncbi:LOW QUALITY PROTEIN: uncharacterized protein LOC135461281 [Liolophura sinensis]|uniref:LOW QUALITY PROTEIN: uncharacterized protein LOC135461281 n=1 Tax=Liolophura sinensis TaxID=3198878 RepID=UPI003159758F